MDPIERAALEELVSESEKARAWIQRLRLERQSPKVGAMLPDQEPLPGQVVRYLAGTMDHEEAVAFDERMLANEPLLAEVSAVHWLLTKRNANGMPGVPLDLRQLLYDVDRVYARSADAMSVPERVAGQDENQEPEQEDELYEEAVRIVLSEKRGAATLLQRMLKIGYTRASRLIELMERDGIVGRYVGSKSRDVLISLEDWENRKKEKKKSS